MFRTTPCARAASLRSARARAFGTLRRDLPQPEPPHLLTRNQQLPERHSASTRPSVRTRIRSARRSTACQWDTTRQVAPVRANTCSQHHLHPHVEGADRSSQTKSLASRAIMRAAAARWTWPPERRIPRGPMRVSRPSGRARRSGDPYRTGAGTECRTHGRVRARRWTTPLAAPAQRAPGAPPSPRRLEGHGACAKIQERSKSWDDTDR